MHVPASYAFSSPQVLYNTKAQPAAILHFIEYKPSILFTVFSMNICMLQLPQALSKPAKASRHKHCMYNQNTWSQPLFCIKILWNIYLPVAITDLWIGPNPFGYLDIRLTSHDTHDFSFSNDALI